MWMFKTFQDLIKYIFANHVGFSKLQAQLVNFIFKSTFTLFLFSDRTPANWFVVSLAFCFRVLDSFGLIFLTSHKPLLLLPQFSARPDTFKIIFRNIGNSLTTFFFLSFYSGAYSSGVAGHTPEFQNGTNYFETPNHFWDLVVHADEGRSRAQPCEEQSVKVGFRLGHPAHFLGIHPPRDRLREAL